MARIEIDIKPDTLAEQGYSAFLTATRENMLNANEYVMPEWENAPAELRNFWRRWARCFTQQAMGV